ncbi:MAG: TIGR02206 family membrane protein [Clostridia bacterium]|nr:TIGR02206 family membrane protein [Clostridia bacterium]
MFFTTKGNIPDGVGFRTFGAMHLVWLACILLCIIGAAILYRRLDENKRRVMRIILAAAIVFLEIIKDIFHAIVGEFGVGYLPLHLCGINILLIVFDIFKQNNTVRNFLYYFCIAGASLALLFPNWTSLPCWNFSCIHSFSIHGLLVIYPILLVSSGEVKPDLKTMPKCLLLLIGLAIPVYFVNLAFDTNFMFLMRPDKGNPLELFEKLLGNHLWGFPILLPVVMFVMYLPLLLVNKLKKK